MSGLGFPEIMVILIVALLVFGPRKLPELGKSLGAGLREFRRSTQGLKEEFEGAMQETAAPQPAQPVVQNTIQPVQAPTQAAPAQALASQVTVISTRPQVVQAAAVAVAPVVAVQDVPNQQE